nr:hypothetical protein Iba_chr09eCG13980 [Ipomoea batatas]
MTFLSVQLDTEASCVEGGGCGYGGVGYRSGEALAAQMKEEAILHAPPPTIGAAYSKSSNDIVGEPSFAAAASPLCNAPVRDTSARQRP